MKTYPIKDRPSVAEREAFGLTAECPIVGIAAVATGDVRCPKKGEWYLSGAIVEAYKAPNDIPSKYQIAALVQIETKIETRVKILSPIPRKKFKVAAISANTNSFGLHQFIFIAQDGKALKACGNSLRAQELPRGSIVALDQQDLLGSLSALSFELPEENIPAPKQIVDQVWADDFGKAARAGSTKKKR